MRISDWSSDVCSSDLLRVRARLLIEHGEELGGGLPAPDGHELVLGRADDAAHPALGAALAQPGEVHDAGAGPGLIDALAHPHRPTRLLGVEGRHTEDNIAVAEVGLLAPDSHLTTHPPTQLAVLRAHRAAHTPTTT